jgi:WD repeat-containing protein 22
LSVCSGDPLEYFLHEQPVYGLSIDPINDNVFASACDDGRILIYDIRSPPGTGKQCCKFGNSSGYEESYLLRYKAM